MVSMPTINVLLLWRLPVCYQPLMTDGDSPILDFYPLKFSIDLNGKRQEWEAVVLIPFIDEVCLDKRVRARVHTHTNTVQCRLLL